MKNANILIGIIITVFFLNSCQTINKGEAKSSSLDFEIVEEDDIPEEMAKLIKKEQEKPFQIVYGDGEKMYIGQGYGAQDQEGYGVEVDLCQEGEEVIKVHTVLWGPGSAEEDRKSIFMREGTKSSMPYIVFSVKWNEKQVIFDANKGERTDGINKETSTNEPTGKNSNGSIYDR